MLLDRDDLIRWLENGLRLFAGRRREGERIHGGGGDDFKFGNCDRVNKNYKYYRSSSIISLIQSGLLKETPSKR